MIRTGWWYIAAALALGLLLAACTREKALALTGRASGDASRAESGGGAQDGARLARGRRRHAGPRASSAKVEHIAAG